MVSYQDALREVDWEDERLVEGLVVGSYRHAVTIVCSRLGRQKAWFANGEFPYFAYVDLLGGGGKRISHGNNIVPVLPDGRVVMVIEQRPTLARYPDHPRLVEFSDGRSVDLGPYGSLEFPGGVVNPGESLTAGFLRELQEETGVGEQKATLYRRVPPIYPLGSDVAIQMFLAVIELTGFSFAERVEDDGGLTVLALRPEEVDRNIHKGLIASGQAALLGWNFYCEIMLSCPSSERLKKLEQFLEEGFLSIEEVQLVVPR